MSEFDDPRLSALYRQTPASEPDPHSDALIVDAAHKAVPKKARRSYAPWAVAATLVLGIGIGWQVLHLTPPPVAPVDDETVSAPPVPAPAPAAEDVVPRRARAAPPAAAESRAVEADSDALLEAPLGSMLGGAAKRSDIRKEADRPAPAAVMSQGEGLSSFARSPLDIEAESEKGVECSAFWPRAGLAAEQWRTLIEKARTAGDAVRLRCLELRHRELFGAQPGAVTVPVPDK